MNLVDFLLPLITLMVCLRAPAIGTWLEVMDHPDGIRKTHGAPTPLVGGLAVMAPFLMICAYRWWENPDDAVAYALLIAVGYLESDTTPALILALVLAIGSGGHLLWLRQQSRLETEVEVEVEVESAPG